MLYRVKGIVAMGLNCKDKVYVEFLFHDTATVDHMTSTCPSSTDEFPFIDGFPISMFDYEKIIPCFP